MDEALAASRYGHGMLVRYKRGGQLFSTLKRLPIASLFFLALAYGPVHGGGPQADDLPTSGLVPCPDCKATGKVSCPTCDGKGEIYKPCEICKGSGQKTCPGCSKEAKGQAAVGPGLVPCTYCGGKGTVGPNGKLCFHCNGEKTLTCEVCAGKGTLPCNKQVYESVCPACRFVKKITCPTCGGALSVSPQALLARKRSPERSSANGKEGKKPEGGANPSPAGEPAGELSARYRKLTGIHDAHVDIFATDPRPRVETLRSELAKLQSQLREGGSGAQSQVTKDLEALVKRMSSFQRRWEELRKLFAQEHNTFGTVRSTLDSSDRAKSESPRRLSDEEEEKLTRRLELALKIAEKNAGLLAREEPEWLSRELAAVEALTPGLKKKGEAELLKVAQAASLKASSSAAKKAKPAAADTRELSGDRRGARARSREGRAGGARDPLSTQLTRTEESSTREARDETGESDAAEQDEQDEQDDDLQGRASLLSRKPTAGRKSDPDDPADKLMAKPSRSFPVGWALFGFAAAALLIVTGSKLRSKMAKPTLEEGA
jgi:hypothetical protein